MHCQNNGALIRQKLDLSKYTEKHHYSFDYVFDEKATNKEIYSTILRPLIASTFNQTKVACFAYGQTGSGKTFTMLGNNRKNIPGLYLLAAEDIFRVLNSPDFSFLCLGVSFYELYCEKAFDLLNNRNSCFIRADSKENVHLIGLTEKAVIDVDGLLELIGLGLERRKSGATNANDSSSRSHAVLHINLRNRENKELFGRLSFIDLAGSERGADTNNNDRQTRRDGAEINKSLLALKECIRALDLEKKHLPFRGSKLTLVLKDSFLGESKTVMIGNISPGAGESEHTLNTLRYAERVKELRKEGGGKQLSKEDKKARQLMLPRMNINSKKEKIKEDNNGDRNIKFDVYDVNNKNRMDNDDCFRRDKNKGNYYNEGWGKERDEWKGLQNTRSNEENRKTSFPQNQDRFQTNLREIQNDSGLFERNQSLGHSMYEHFQPNKEHPGKNNFSFQKKPQPNNNDIFVKQPEGERNFISNREEEEFRKKRAEEREQMFSDFQEQLLADHSEHIDKIVGLVKEDMNVIQSIQGKPTDLVDYLSRSKEVLAKKKSALKKFESILQSFDNELEEIENKRRKEGFDDQVFGMRENGKDMFDGFRKNKIN